MMKFDIPWEEYCELPHINQSFLKVLLQKTPAHAITERPEGPAMRRGKALHAAFLEPEEYKSRFIVGPKVDRRTKDGKTKWAEFLEEAGDREIVTSELDEQVSSIREALLKSERVQKIICGADFEVTTTWDTELDLRTGDISNLIDSDRPEKDIVRIGCKCRCDILNKGRDNGWIAADIKTTEDASKSAFSRSVAKFCYNIQAAFTIDGLQDNGCDLEYFAFIVVESKPPYAVAVYELTEEAIAAGRQDYLKALKIYHECASSGKWPAYEQNEAGDFLVDLPSWKQRFYPNIYSTFEEGI